MLARFKLTKFLSGPTRPMIAVALVGFAAASTLLGMRALIGFEHTASAQNRVPARWPHTSALAGPATRAKLLVFVHPFCSCTAATIFELARFSGKEHHGMDTPEITVLVTRPKNSHWQPQKALWRDAQALLGARILWDEGGDEAKRFGAKTSGFVVLYSARGELLFHGGVTESRGHRGDNYGLDQLAGAIRSQQRSPDSTKVFGCALAIPDPLEIR